MERSLEDAERERMEAFLNKGRTRDTAERLAALRDSNSDAWKKYRELSREAAIANSGAGSGDNSGASSARGKRKTGQVKMPDWVVKPSVLRGVGRRTRAGPRTRFGDGDGSWWDRWLSFEPPRVSSYSNGFVAPLNGFKRERMVAEKGAWVDDPAHHKRLMPGRAPSKVQVDFARTMLAKPKELEDSDDSLDESQGSASSDDYSDEDDMAVEEVDGNRVPLMSPVASFRLGPGGFATIDAALASSAASSFSLGRRPGSRTRSLPPLSPDILKTAQSAKDLLAAHKSGKDLLAGGKAMNRSGSKGGGRSAPLSSTVTLGVTKMPAASAAPSGTSLSATAPHHLGHLADSLGTQPGGRVRSASFVPPEVLNMLSHLKDGDGSDESDADEAELDAMSDSDVTHPSSDEENLDAEEAHERSLTRKFHGQRARWKLYHKYRNIDRTFSSEHTRHTDDSEDMFLGPVRDDARRKAIDELDAVTSPRSWIASQKFGGTREGVFSTTAPRLQLPRTLAGAANTAPAKSMSTSRLTRPRNSFQQFERPQTSVGVAVPTTARQRFVSHCRAASIPPEPLIISRKQRQRTNQLLLSHYGIGNRVGKALAAGVSGMEQLEFVDLRNNRLSGDAVRLLCKALKRSQVVTLNLSENRVGRAGCIGLANLLQATTSLTYLNLDRCKVADSGTKSLVAGLRDKNCPLKELILSNNDLGSASGVLLGDTLTVNHTLKKLLLAWNGIRRRGAVRIATALQSNTTLQYLDVAWNGFGVDGGNHMGVMLSTNTSLRTLDLSHNSVEASSAMVIANSLRKNSTLTNLQMNGNPLAYDGGRALMRCMDTTGDVRIIGLEDCNFEMEQKVSFDPSNPAGVYSLNMEKPFDRTVAEELLRLAADLPGCVIARCAVAVEGRGFKVKRLSRQVVQEGDAPETKTEEETEDRQVSPHEDDHEILSESDSEAEEAVHARRAAVEAAMKKNFRAFMGDEPGKEWLLPDKGLVEMVVTYRPQRTKKWQATRGNGVAALMSMMKAKNMTLKHKKQLLSMATTDMFFSSAQASDIVTVFAGAQGGSTKGAGKKQTAGRGDKLDAVYSLLPRLVDPENSKDLIREHLDESDQRRLAFKLGQLARFSPDNPTGHYRLDLSVETDRRLFQQLVSVAGDQAQTSKRSGYGDTSQHGNWENFRNATMNDEPFKLESDFPLHETPGGVLEFDYTSTDRPKRFARKMRRKAFATLVDKLSKGLRGIKVTRPTANQRNPQWIPPRVAEEEDLHEDSPEALALYPPLVQLDPESQGVLDEMLSVLRLRVATTWLATPQALKLVKLFPTHVSTSRMEAVIAVFGRLLRLHEAAEPLRNLVPRVERRILLSRLGWLNALNPFNPDAFYVVDLERHEERYVAIMLVELAVAEPGENWEGETFNGISGWELPMSWTKEVPFKGNLTLEYTTTGPGCAPDWDCRKRLLEFFLCGRRG